MTTTTFTHSLTYMFKDEDWFWKVSLGACALLAIGCGAGYFLVMGYQVETVRRCRMNETTLPEWNSPRLLWRTGLTVGSAMLCYTAIVLGGLASIHHASVLSAVIGIVVIHTFLLPFVTLRFLERGSFASCLSVAAIASLVRKNGLRAAEMTAAGFSIFVVVVCLGWMALIVGWLFFIFWGMLVAASFTASLAPSSDISGAPAQ
jgi:hypothetical protein